MIVFDNVSKKYSDGTLALEDINFSIKGGEFVFITGPSGAGKTSLLKLIIREETPSLGEIFVDENSITKIKPKEVPSLRRKIGFIFQDFKLLESLTVFENVALTLEVVGRGDKDIKDAVGEVLNLVGLSEKINSFPSLLSGGEKQRVAIARALVHEPKILLADEPTGMIDPATGWEIVNLLEKINGWGTTVVVATHNLDVVSSLNKRDIKIEKGRLVSGKKI
ncbi:cell division ATP-binding protein FtsE [candidate division WWE3 bacterium CG09_land_8_20_14_0_10_39_24]|uniref:Cell division ATP-binding protein FtsE n=2 Tax=Katanobacteria TaxID=422282 RepID=A0A2G9XBQ9_UNCKA|nr:MAG: cell division ATP-binding protein FtsE [bacterium CG2_30_40_12]OJI09096.1 MAG: cell division ATP-binding protein FtsE [bacterium CG09_39_24]PIP04392.1 MAG: cell division ATP-binding protein FtsE [candidate division WWE3 bacterium CG23_combo_of_CG06-09_8_20_14_all_40_14]PIS12955.1 MAG: cell division ATP-binding protein FtsE [candidate division WWE3 bacterium CG09_land_8_20_14_0_10_39_24]PJE51832.1 MAG: cell division ATP-binding protein FtsE [candidate division WWE3 bacterium CG10_big_fil